MHGVQDSFVGSILMQWAEGGSLDDFIDVRLGKATASPLYAHPGSSRSESRRSSRSDIHVEENPSVPLSRGARIRAFRAMQHASPEERERLRRELSGRGQSNDQEQMKAVHLLSAEEVKSLFRDVVEGLAFLVRPMCHSKGRKPDIILSMKSRFFI